jgi:glycosyltransferase involved in cell wall biosynthesis
MGVAGTGMAATTAREDMRRDLNLGNGPVLIFVGRLVAQKGVADLLRALAFLIADWPTASAVIVGDGPERAHLEACASELKIAERVRFAGNVDPARVPGYLAAADIFVAPAKAAPEGTAEGQGLAIIEAMLAGIPVVASRSGGVIDAVRQEETGLLVDEGAPAQIAAAVARLLRDRTLAKRLSTQARSMAAEAYSTDRAANAYAQLFAGVLAGTTKRSGP